MSSHVLVTGATGSLGKKVVGAATEAGHRVRALSRRSHVGYSGVHWAQGDLNTATGLAAAVDGVDVIVHCATQPASGKDVASTENLIASARRARVGHLIYVSIVGIDTIPLPYYKAKLRAERLVEAAGLGYTVQRATQFHDLIERIFSAQRFSPVLWTLAGVRFQPVDTGAVADRLVELIGAGPTGRVADIGGPAVHSHADLGRMFLTARVSRRRVLDVPLPGRIVAGFRSGANLVPDSHFGSVNFEQYLRRSMI
jgi:uncharacterized protein YbjT (DUF2867 family)